MDHGGHGGHDGHGTDGMLCKMQMLWNSDTSATCIVFPSLRVHSTASLLFYMIALFTLAVAYEKLRIFAARHEAQVRTTFLADWEDRRKRGPSPTPATALGESEPDESTALLKTGDLVSPYSNHVRLPITQQLSRSALYVANVALSFFLMLVVMTYNSYLIFSVLAGAFVGHFVLQRDLPLSSLPDDLRGMQCH